MARLLPAISPDQISVDSERLVYDALRALPDEFVVLHSFPWLRPNRDLASEPLREGEADFVVLHPDRGLLVLEVKGGTPALRNRTWFRGAKEMRDPFEQARRNRYALLEAIEERTRGRLRRAMFSHGDAVVFPHCTYEGPLPVNADPRILLDARSLPHATQSIEQAFEAWSRAPTRLSPTQFAELLECLLPKLRLLRCVGSELASESARLVQITLDQRATMVGLLGNDRVLVQGTAGSGKTLLALEFGLTLKRRGESALLLCYNHHLASWLQEQAAADERYTRGPGRLEIATFHGVALSLARRAGVEFDVPERNAQAFWDDEVPLILEQALEVLRERGSARSFDAVIVDEAQDFSPDWWVTVESLTKLGRRGRLYAFLDLHQSLRGEARLPPVEFSTQFKLNTNCRNTKSIARGAAALCGADVVLLPGSPEGEPPAVRHPKAREAAGGLALAEVRALLAQGLRPQQVALISPWALSNGPLESMRHSAPVQLTDETRAWRENAGVLVTTARSFKGLEADVVVIFGVSAFSPLFTRTDLYVAWTRARHRLVLICTEGEVRSVVEGCLHVPGAIS